MKQHRGGWGKYSREHALKVGDHVRYAGHEWQIWYQSGNRKQVELLKEQQERSEKVREKLSPEMKAKYPQMATIYIFRIQKVKRQVNYKPLDWYRLLRRVKG